MENQQPAIPDYSAVTLTDHELSLLICYRAIPKWYASLTAEQKCRVAAMPDGRRPKFIFRAVHMWLMAGVANHE